MTYIEFKNSHDHFTVDEYANAKAVEELEKIKIKIMELQTDLCFEVVIADTIDEEKYSEQIKGMTETINIINESISELKEQ